jgi:CubicO group peptidase (beta-lactamase class C family)
VSGFIEANSPTRYSLLVIRNGYLVFERYYHGSHAGQANNIKSMSKSVLSVLTGIAIEDGRIGGTSRRLHEFFPEFFHAGLDARKFDITLEHMLTMTAGFEWDENTEISDRLWRSSNWMRTMIEFPMADAPGETFNYNTGLTHLDPALRHQYA